MEEPYSSKLAKVGVNRSFKRHKVVFDAVNLLESLTIWAHLRRQHALYSEVYNLQLNSRPCNMQISPIHTTKNGAFLVNDWKSSFRLKRASDIEVLKSIL